MATLSGSFERDLVRFLDPNRPVALARFHDGEHHVLLGQPYDAKSGWHLYRPSWMRERLLEALSANLDNYWVGISPPCDYPLGTAFFRPHLRTRLTTFATIFWHRNLQRFRSHVEQHKDRYAIVGSSGRCTYRVPANGVANKWDIDALVGELLAEERSILVAAGPCACVIVHEYWKRQAPERRRTILDAGAALDGIVHGKWWTRSFLQGHACSWDHSVPWSHAAGRKPKGYRARLAGLRTRFGGKKKDHERRR